jgi:hypothetical protein
MPPRKALRTHQIPKTLWTAQGTVPVLHHPILQSEEAFGLWRMDKRVVEIDSDCAPATQLTTLGHEMMEMILWDSGLHYLLEANLKEALCDAVGGYMAGAILAGHLTLQDPKDPKAPKAA